MASGIVKLKKFLLEFKKKLGKNEETLSAQNTADFSNEKNHSLQISHEENYPKNEINILRITEHLTPEDRAVVSDESTIYTNLTLGQINLPPGFDYVLLPDELEKYQKVKVSAKKEDGSICHSFATICCKKELNTRIDYSFENNLLCRKLVDLSFFKEYMRFLELHNADIKIMSLITIKEIIYSLIVIGDAEFKKIGKSPVISIEPNADGTFDIASLINYGPNKYFIMKRCQDNDQGHFICLCEKQEKIDKTSLHGDTKTVINQVIYIDKNGLVSGVEYNRFPNFVRRL